MKLLGKNDNVRIIMPLKEVIKNVDKLPYIFDYFFNDEGKIKLEQIKLLDIDYKWDGEIIRDFIDFLEYDDGLWLKEPLNNPSPFKRLYKKIYFKFKREDYNDNSSFIYYERI